jgi:hypothetical protein
VSPPPTISAIAADGRVARSVSPRRVPIAYARISLGFRSAPATRLRKRSASTGVARSIIERDCAANAMAG